MRAKDVMAAPVVTAREEETLEDAARLMLEHRIGGLAVVDADGRLVGFLTESDFVAREEGVPFSLVRAPKLLGEWLGEDGVERIYEQARRLRVRDVMAKPAIAVKEDAPLTEVVRLMMERDVNRVVVVRDRVPVGMVARHDLLRLMTEPRAQP